MQRDGLHRGAAVAAVGRSPTHTGAGMRVSRSIPMMDLIVLMAERPSAPPACRGRATAADVAHVRRQLHQHRVCAQLPSPSSVINSVYSGTWPTALPMPALAHAVRAAEVELQAVRARVFGLADDGVPGSRFDSTISEAMTACFG